MFAIIEKKNWGTKTGVSEGGELEWGSFLLSLYYYLDTREFTHCYLEM